MFSAICVIYGCFFRLGQNSAKKIPPSAEAGSGTERLEIVYIDFSESTKKISFKNVHTPVMLL